MRTWFSALIIAMLGVMLPGQCATQVCADPPDPSADQAETAPRPEPIVDLKTALDSMTWNSAKRGALLVVAPAAVVPPAILERRNFFDSILPDPPDALYEPADGAKFSADRVATYFKSHFVRCSTLSAFVPDEMLVLNTHLKPPDLNATLSDSDKLQRFVANLSVAQWGILAGENGIGLADLKGSQQKLFLSLLPEHASVETQKVIADPDDHNTTNVEVTATKDLNAEDREATRLRLDLSSDIQILDLKSRSALRSLNGNALRKQVTHLISHDSDAELLEVNRRRNEPSSFGQSTQIWASNRLKPGPLDFASPELDIHISTVGAATVGDLIRRIRNKSGLRIFSDGRLARLPVYLSTTGMTLRSGDVLKALCLEMGATIRKIDVGGNAESPSAPHYVLTYDVQGLGAIEATVEAWIQQGENRTFAAQNQWSAVIQAHDPLKYVTGPRDDPLAPPPAAVSTIRSEWGGPHPDAFLGHGTIAISTLTETQRRAVQRVTRQEIAKQQANPWPGFHGIDGVVVDLSLKLVPTFIVPGGYEAQWDNVELNFGVDPNVWAPKKETVSLTALPPLQLTNAILIVAPKTVAECDAIMDVARSRTIRRVWIPVGDDATSHARLSDAIASGKSHGIAVFALTSLMSASTAESGLDQNQKGQGDSANPLLATDSCDLNVFGETSAAHAGRPVGEAFERSLMPVWSDSPCRITGSLLAPEAPATLRLLTRKLAALAGTPGLAGIAFKDIAGPGHDWLTMSGSDAVGPDDNFGFTAANRVKFLEDEGYDPIDLPARVNDSWKEHMRYVVAVAYFDSDGSDPPNVITTHSVSETIQRKWSVLRIEAQKRLLANLYCSLDKLRPGLPLYISNPDEEDARFVAWTAATPLLAEPVEPDAAPLADQAKKAGQQTATVARLPWCVCTPDLLKEAATPQGLLSADAARRLLVKLVGNKANQSVKGEIANPVILDFTAIPIPGTIELLRDGLAGSTH